MLVIGTALIAVSIQCIYDPIGMVTGGFTGLAIIIKEISKVFIDGGISLGIANICLNIPFFVFAWLIKGKRFIWRTIVGTVLLSVWMDILPAIDLAQGDYTLAAISVASSAVPEWDLCCWQKRPQVERRWWQC